MRMPNALPEREDRYLDKVASYSEPIYRYCVKRLGATEEAEDLAQEILVEAIEGLRRHEVDNLDAWIWTVARNRYRRLFLRPRAGRDAITLSVGDEPASEEPGIEERVLLEEDKEQAYRAVVGIAEKYRRVLVAYYVHGASYEEISRRLAIPLSSVKWRIHEGRRKLRERWVHQMSEGNRVYDRIEWWIACNGSMDPNRYLDPQIARAICTASYQKPLSVEEICRATGIPALYIEDEIPSLLHGEALEERGGKYATAFIILKLADHRGMIRKLQPLVTDLASQAIAGILEREEAIRGLRFYGSDAPLARLLWILMPRVIRAATRRVRMGLPEFAAGEYPKRKDGGHGWFVVAEGSWKDYPDAAGENAYGPCGDRAKLHYYWILRTFSNRMNEVLHALESRAPRDFFGGEGMLKAAQAEDLAAMMIECGLAEKRGREVALTAPLLTAEQNRKLACFLDEVAETLAGDLTAVVREVHEAYQGFVPARLHGQIRGVIGSQLNNLAGLVMGRLEEEGAVEPPAAAVDGGRSVLVEITDEAAP